MNTVTAIYPDGAELEFDIPENWTELNRKQFAAVAPLLYNGDVINLLSRFAYLILGKKLFKQISGEENMDEFVHAFSFITSFPVLPFSHYKGFTLFGKRYFGIDDKLLDMTIDDYGMLEQCLAYFEDKTNQKIFYEILHKRGWLKIFPISENKKAALRLNYEAARANIPAMYPGLKYSNDNKTPDYHELIVKLAGKEFGNLKQTRTSMLHDVLKKMEIDTISAAKTENPNTLLV